jgi:hypothetical protein
MKLINKVIAEQKKYCSVCDMYDILEVSGSDFEMVNKFGDVRYILYNSHGDDHMPPVVYD